MSFKNLRESISFSSEKMKKNNIFETSRFLCDVYCFEPGQEQKVHAHDDQDKVYLVLEGTGNFKVGNVEKQLSKDTVVLAEGGIDHGVKNTGNSRLMLFVFVAPSGLKKGEKSHQDGHGHEHSGHNHGHHAL